MADHKECKAALERAVYQILYRIGGYYGCVISAMQHKFDESVGTAGVRFVKEEKAMELVIAPSFFLKLTEPERVALLLHEVYHVLWLHVLNRDKNFPDKKNGNIACDIAINDTLAGQDPTTCKLPEGAMYASKFNLPANKAAEFYYEELAKQQKQEQKQEQQQSQGGDDQQQQPQPKKGRGKKQQQAPEQGNGQPEQANADGESMDVHDWDASGKPTEEKLDALKNVLERAKERAAQLGSVGKIPAEVEEALEAIEKMKVRQWHRELRRFIARNTDSSEQERTWSRPNKRYGLWEAGTKSGPNKRLIIGVDTSGSMSEDEINQALAECRSMLRCSVEAEVWFFDTQVNNKQKLKKNAQYKTGGRGGTDFNDFLTQAKRQKPDGVVIFSDGDDGRTIPEDPKVPLLWVLTAGDREDFYPFGHKVVLDK